MAQPRRRVPPLADQLEAHLRSIPAAPYLFVGAGLSRRYANTDDWQSLLARFAAPLPRPFEYYLSSADGDLPRVASLLRSFIKVSASAGAEALVLSG